MIYFDNSATTQPYPDVLETAQTVAMNYFANPSSAHPAGEASSSLLEQARKQFGQLLGYQSQEIYFTASGTEANNWVFQAILQQLKVIHPHKNKVLISAVEHPSITNQIPLLQQRGFEVILLEVDGYGRLDVDKLEDHLADDVLLLSTIAVNNEVGTLQPFKEIETLLTKYPQIIWHVDAVQAMTTQMELVKRSRIDLLTLSSHKFHGIRGLGVLAQRQRVEKGIWVYGGGQERGLRSGTENLPAIVAGAKALRMTQDEQIETKAKLKTFQEQIVQQFKALNWEVFGYPYTAEHIIAVALPPLPGEVILNAFAEESLFVSTTSACSSRKPSTHHTLKAMGIPDAISKSTIRISLASTNTLAEVEQLLLAIERITQKLSAHK
ncbi:cysteine desulfurase family protein [Fundicoccus culcitae]|uniref:Cysteine desulfurase n=1 Tax=Fundicoccus culcitae TaxID=2969821 RepID=A0ABY5P5K0_9LACT|nr:cysteine desulfurase family protein [Fundicoccus culcitae]UUX34022.1 cysteine desulfurase [Fundicoccus culcitae]